MDEDHTERMELLVGIEQERILADLPHSFRSADQRPASSSDGRVS